jgi:AmmeMemoRadiSam system protein B
MTSTILRGTQGPCQVPPLKGRTQTPRHPPMYDRRMADLLRPLRRDLDFVPSPDPDHPGLLVRDPLGYSDRILVVPPPLVSFLTLFDGEHDELDLAVALARATDDESVSPIVRSLILALSRAAFLEDDAFAARRAEAHEHFAIRSVREASHAGSAYPAEPSELRQMLDRWLGDAPCVSQPPRTLAGLVAPHVSPEGGWRSYASAYRRITAQDADRTFVVIGTSHHGDVNTLGVTRKPYRTPLGETTPDPEACEILCRVGGEAVRSEDYCHAVEHSVEFQVLFLQHLLGPAVRMVPVLCGPFVPPGGALPEADAGVARILDAVRVLTAQREDALFVVGVDFAHVGQRYHDEAQARANEGPLLEVAARDKERLAHIEQGDAAGFWRCVGDPAEDSLHWCGTAPLYTLLRSVGPVFGNTLHYEQWNIDPASVVTFAGMEFVKGNA